MTETTKKEEDVVEVTEDTKHVLGTDNKDGISVSVAENEFTSSFLVPDKVPNYVPYGFFNEIRAIIKSEIFLPVYISGPSGNGKTIAPQQICSLLGREMILVPITEESDEDSLLGGFRLIKGETVWQDGPVITAMKRGAILVLDECDLATFKIMCLQPVVDGKSIYLKKINEVVKPAPGFNIIATANTKGRGSADGRFIGTNIQNEAFLDRFPITIEQRYPPFEAECKIISGHLKDYGIPNKDYTEFTETLVKWAAKTREAFINNASDDLISTRRLVNIVKAYGIFNSDTKAIKFCTNRFEDDVKEAFVESYKKISKESEEKMKKAKAAAKVKGGQDPGAADFKSSPQPITGKVNPKGKTPDKSTGFTNWKTNPGKKLKS